MHIVAYVILAAWPAFWIYWLVIARGVKAGQSRSGSLIAIRVGIVLVVLLVVRGRALRMHEVTNDPWLQGIGLALFVLGLALAIWARRYLGRNWGAPMSRKEDPELVMTGPYHSIRHPIYAGIILAWIGTAIAVSFYWLVAAALFGAYFIYSAFMEERLMEGLFPDTYPAYKRSTKMLVPFIF